MKTNQDKIQGAWTKMDAYKCVYNKWLAAHTFRSYLPLILIM